MNGWEELILEVKRIIEYGVHCNDLSPHDMEDDLCAALDKFAQANGLPETKWETW